ncbi:mitogen-activated protein kinase 15 [Reticulomyxa filosa]|uniref:Mitogen-activated protein kinase 15 n=1 Tax=Reticulomyxa filosa TaxID=46433 RepID=X6PBH6_RETFI|nr:mitogen-activated protein kinase 15 [Reticulomyxa filosa]|eukprot:ETO35399.1 mitogen-activated protein kinase 15 [Reticulomyxa filosa]
MCTGVSGDEYPYKYKSASGSVMTRQTAFPLTQSSFGVHSQIEPVLVYKQYAPRATSPRTNFLHCQSTNNNQNQAITWCNSRNQTICGSVYRPSTICSTTSQSRVDHVSCHETATNEVVSTHSSKNVAMENQNYGCSLDKHYAARYKNVTWLGKGAYGMVWEAIALSDVNQHVKKGDRVAIKTVARIFSNVLEAKRLLRELNMLKIFRGHGTIVQLLDIVPVFPDGTSFTYLFRRTIYTFFFFFCEKSIYVFPFFFFLCKKGKKNTNKNTCCSLIIISAFVRIFIYSNNKKSLLVCCRCYFRAVLFSNAIHTTKKKKKITGI